MVDITIDERLCKGCYYCIQVCPNDVLGKSDKLSPKGYIIAKIEHPKNCIVCRSCERICPDFAISVIDDEDKNNSKNNQK